METRRTLFQEMDTARAAAPTVGMIDHPRRGARRWIRFWLMTLFALVVVMIAVGGLTRLTDSGLSITEWNPVMGALPPLSDADWTVEFEKYKAIPQYRLVNEGMSLDEFQRIFWWEWGHRQLGRVIGLVWAVGFFGFLATRRIPVGWSGRLLAIGGLVGVQGAIGWWMVSSGVTGGLVSVASYRLAIHLGLAFVILGVIAWYVFLLGRADNVLLQARRQKDARLFGMGTGLMHLAFVQILLGALVAGIDAGRGFTDWPLMAGQVFPPEAFVLTPWWSNFFENPGLVQFVHRMTGYALFAFGIVAWVVARRSANEATVQAFTLVAAMMVVQLLLGIVTVLNAAALPVAILHQFTAVLLWVIILRARFLAQYPLAQTIRRTA